MEKCNSVNDDVMETNHHAVIVAHGWPSNPARLEADLAWLGRQVEGNLVNWRVRTATLAAPFALQQVLARSDSQMPLHIYPFFMSDGWFVSSFLRRRVGEIRSDNLIWHQPFGMCPALTALCESLLLEHAGNEGFSASTLIAVAHGSPDNPRPAKVARDLTQKLVEKFNFKTSRNGFVDEAPFLDDVLKIDGPAVCLPLFASLAGHVREDLATGLDKTGFEGTVLPVIGTHRDVPRLIANELAGKIGQA